jgi:hypothetical protein
MQRDAVANKKIVNMGTIVADSTGDDDGTVVLDTKGLRGAMFVLLPSVALTTQESYFQLLESSDAGVADAYAEVAADKYLPTLNQITDGGDSGILIKEPTAPYEQPFGAVGTERYLKVRIHTDVSQASVTFTIIAVCELEVAPFNGWDPAYTGVDGNP